MTMWISGEDIGLISIGCLKLSVYLACDCVICCIEASGLSPVLDQALRECNNERYRKPMIRKKEPILDEVLWPVLWSGSDKIIRMVLCV